MLKHQTTSDPLRDQLIYLAGIFDGEGSISFQGTCNVSIGQTYRPTLHDFMSLFGGSVRLTRRPGQKMGSGTVRKPVYSWSLSGGNAANFLRAILPFLREKREQAIVAIQAQELIDTNRYSQDPEYRAAKERLAARLREMKVAGCGLTYHPYMTAGEADGRDRRGHRDQLSADRRDRAALHRDQGPQDWSLEGLHRQQLQLPLTL